jgi:hypothetical protein
VIVLTIAGLLLMAQALLVLNVACDPATDRMSRAWSAVLVGASLLGAFSLFGWLA